MTRNFDRINDDINNEILEEELEYLNNSYDSYAIGDVVVEDNGPDEVVEDTSKKSSSKKSKSKKSSKKSTD